ncbi:MAG TPA: CotH kinase family protein, partial [Longimicrobiales bacterium]|nr:CotH kinase family protein [Longimicrobiales bacterium]
PVTLAAGQYLVIFASGKDRAAAGSELHTTFRLSKEAEYLALVRPDGASVAHDYGPVYPPQHDDVSYGIGDGGTAAQLVALGAGARFRVPSSDADGLAWTLPGFDDGAWAPATIGVGHETGAGEPPPPGDTNLALNAGATQTSEYGGFPAERAVDGDPGNFTATSASDPSPAWEVDLGGVFPLSSIVVRNRGDGCCPSRLRDIRVSVLDGEGDVVFESAVLNPENTLGGGGAGGPANLTVDLLALAGGAVSGRYVRVARIPDPDNSGTGGVGGPDEAHVLSLGEVEVFAVHSAYSEWIRTDVGPAMRGVSASLHLRVPFELSDPGPFERLSLRMRYDDGFVAYLNGTEVARRNAPGEPGQGVVWNAAATAEHSGVSPEEIDITSHLGLLAAGENVLAVHGLSSSAADEDFLIAPELEARTGQERTLVYFQNPTPGAPNDPSGVIDFVGDTKFSVGRGFFEEPFEVEITSATPGAQVRYTLDRSAPTATTGLAVEGPLRITATTVLRAAAFKQGFAPTNVDTQTYIFLDDVLKQPAMLKDIVSHAVYGPELKPSLMAVPTVSVVTRATLNPATEVEASVELIHPDGTDGFQIDAGVKKVGGHSVGAYPKNNMRLYFRKKYGQGKLEYPIFKGLPYGDRAVEEFDRLNLRSSHDTIFYLGDAQQSPADAQYIRNRWINYTQFEMGHPSMNGRFVQVYINGTYWGLYDFMEWPSQDYLSAHFGGERADYAATSGGRPIGDSSIAAWNRIVGLAGNYPELGRYLDLTNFADYLILNFYCGNAWDWNPNQNWMSGGPVAPDQGGFKLFCWDSDIILRRTNDYNLDRGGPGNLYQSLRANPEFRVLLGDRAHKHLSGSGALTPAQVTRSYSARADEIRSALVAETARWRWGNRVWTRDNQWQRELTRLLGDFIPRRTAIVLDQLRQAGLYPRIAAPTLSQSGGLVPEGFGLSISAPEGAVHYTTDGSDPRLPGGNVNPAAREIGVATVATLLSSGAAARAHVPPDGSLGLAWTRADFDDASWRTGTTGVGFERAAGYEALIGIDVEAESFEVNGSA